MEQSFEQNRNERIVDRGEGTRPQQSQENGGGNEGGLESRGLEWDLYGGEGRKGGQGRELG